MSLNPKSIRLSRIGIVNAEKMAKIENFIIGKVQKGEITTKVTDDQLVKYIDECSKFGGGAITSVRVQRKRADDSDDDLDLEDD